MEINSVEISHDVLEYLDTDEARFEDAWADFEEFKARYERWSIPELAENRRSEPMPSMVSTSPWARA